jgi:hypothetical protein
MLKLSFWRTMVAFLVALLVTACGGGTGDSAPAPDGFKVTPGNGQVIISWTASPGVQYWLMYAPTTTSIDIKNPPSNHAWATNISSPYVISGLTNGVTYSFAMNGRTSGGKGGVQTASQSVTPGYAGTNWIAGTSPLANMRGISYGTANAAATYVAVGTGGAVYKAPDGVSQSVNGMEWAAVTGVPTTIDFNASTYAYGKYIAVGKVTGGVNNVYYSADATTWTGLATTGSTALNALATNGTTVVAVGDGGKVFYSTDAATWTAATGLTALGSDLYGVAYSATGLWVAVGQNGTLITSPDGMSWTVQTAISVPGGYKLNSVAATSSGLFVSVGNHGTILTSSNGTSWTAQNNSSIADLNAVSTDSVQFLAVGATGTVLTSPDASTWTSITQTANVNALTAIAGSTSKYLVVGTSGSNISSIR